MTVLSVAHEEPRFDWYQATVEMSGLDLVDLAHTVLGDERPRLMAGKNGYGRVWELRRGGSRCAVVMEGGQHEHPHILGTGQDADPVAALVRRRGPAGAHRVARGDVAGDTDAPGAFGALYG